MTRSVERAIEEQHDLERRSGSSAPVSTRWARLRDAFVDADAVAAVTVARLALQEAHLAVLQARLRRIDAGEAEPDAAVEDGHAPLPGRNPVSRDGPALAHGLRGKIEYILTRTPRGVVKSLAISLALGLLYLGLIRAFVRDRKQRWLLPYLGL
jgi:hypothetical protein